MKKSLAILLILQSFNISAGVRRDIVFEHKINNSDCKKNDSCTLKNFHLQVTDYIVSRGKEKSYGTKAIISYQTDQVKHLEDYAVVQFIRGCVYNEMIDKNGKITKYSGTSRQFFGSVEKFNHPNWVIDSIDKDPIYNSSAVTSSRHDYYRWNTNPNSYGENGEDYLIRKYPTFPKVYVSDLPSTSFYSHGSAKSTNLEFNVCIYKTSDIPRETTPDDLDFAKPIHCMKWKTSNVFNFKTMKYEKNVPIEKSCSDL
ncbi:hypothetical protein ACRXCV_12975 [Halobacteriovorax sp. GFR7]|uniref:hypothetical protein n=1 Tax=unclassified Halobacteriovorax TaxID=2639665 RepID=UPI003D979E99